MSEEQGVFVPQYFEIREVGKRIKSTKLQFIWRFQLLGKDVTVEFFNSKMSNKKKIMVNGQLKAEMKQAKDKFHYSMTISGKRLIIQEVGANYDLVYDGKYFQQLWEQEKRKSNFTWENQSRRHDPFEVHQFGNNVSRVVAPTTREDARYANQISNMNRQASAVSAEEVKEIDTPSSSVMGDARSKAIEELEKEKRDMYNDLKSSFGEAEAKQLIKQFMNGRYKKRMAEIEQVYGKSSSGESRSSPKKPSKPRREERKQEEQANFESGFDHGFDTLATFNGRDVGKDEGPRTSISNKGPAATATPAQPAPQTTQQPAAFDFDFTDTQPQSQQPNQPAVVDLDALLSGGPAQKSGSMAAKSVPIFEIESVNQQQPANANPTDPFSNMNVSLASNPNQAAQQQQPQKPAFIPNPMSHKQEQQSAMMNMMQQQMMNMMQQQQFQTNMMMQQQQQPNPFASMPGAQNAFMTVQGGMPANTNAFGTFPQQQPMQQPMQPQFNNGQGNPFGNM